jgi:long-chain acyl-CoA synthetase
MLIHNFLEQSAKRYPAKVALVHAGVKTPYEQINAQANSLAHCLIEKGVRPGDRVAILFENSLEYVVSYYGTLKTGAVAAPLNTDLKPDGLHRILVELEPKALISSSRFDKLLKATDLSQCGLQALILKNPGFRWTVASFKVEKFEELTSPKDTPNPDARIQDSDLASIIYTSGSTGMPKGVMLSHRNIVSNTLSICQYLHLTEKDIQMVVLPFFYVMGKSLLNTHFAVGGSLVINNKFAFPAEVVHEMVAEETTGFSGVPSTYAYLLHRSPLASYRDKFNSLRYCTQAGGHMSRSIKEGLRRALPEHTQIFIMYGATEVAARLSYLDPIRFEDKLDSIGKAIPGVTIRILNPKGEEVPPGQVGEIVATGPNIMQGYWKDPEGTAKVLDANGYHTGDQAYQDEEGFFHIVGRNDDLIKVSGHRVNPLEVEDTLMESGLLVEGVALGLPDEILGHRLVVLGVPRDNGCSDQNILGYLAGRLPKFKVPTEIKLTRALPKKSSGKIDRILCGQFFQKQFRVA